MLESDLKTRWTVAELLTTDFPETRWIIPGKIPVGLSILGGRPKLGKSWLMLQISYAVGKGGKIFNEDIEAGKVLYLALEDSARRLKSRIQSMSIPLDCNIDFALRWTPFQGKGIDLLAADIEANAYSLVVVDTLTRATPGVDQAKAEVIGPIISRLHDLAGLHNNAIILVDHTRKPSTFAADPVDDIISSTAKTGAADTIFALYREQGKPGAVLKGRGRDIEEIDMRLSWDRDTFTWQFKGNSFDIEITEHRANILAALDETGKAQASTIAKIVKQDLSNTSKRLTDLVNAGLVSLENIEGHKYYAKYI
ncbi:MAG: AAA family ATPase [Dehalococcoidales bacterium]|nr:AAA family ATPase [Dehalococcoidales bacterium]